MYFSYFHSFTPQKLVADRHVWSHIMFMLRDEKRKKEYFLLGRPFDPESGEMEMNHTKWAKVAFNLFPNIFNSKMEIFVHFE